VAVGTELLVHGTELQVRLRLLLLVLLLLLQVAYGSADVLDPFYTHGVTWQPATAYAAAGAPAGSLTVADAYVSKAESLPALPANCIWYKVGGITHETLAAGLMTWPLLLLLSFRPEVTSVLTPHVLQCLPVVGNISQHWRPALADSRHSINTSADCSAANRANTCERTVV
jgi:hypothetical protein